MKSNDIKTYLSGVANAVFAFNTNNGGGGSGSAPYNLGKLTKANRQFNPLANSGDQAVIESTPLMENRARDLRRNSPLFKRAVDVLRDIVVGSGIHTYADPIDWSFGWDLKRRPEAELTAAFDYSLEADEKFLDWAQDKNQVDVAGKLNLFEMQALAFSEDVTVGTALIVRQARRGPGSNVPLRFQLIEREQIDTTRDRQKTDSDSSIRGGFMFDSSNREIGVFVYDEHPHGPYSGGGFKSTFIPADRYFHLYKTTRPSQNLGASWMHAAAQPLHDRDTFLLQEIRSAVKAALFTLVTKTKDGGGAGVGFDSTVVPGVTKNSDREIALGTNPIAANLLTDESIEMVESSRPNANANNFYDLIDHDFAGAAGLSYYSTTGRFEKTNYGGFRGAMNLENLQTCVIQDWLGWQIARPIRQAWNFLAIAAGDIETIGAAQAMKERRRFSRFDCIGPGRHLLDADKENSGDATELRGGLSHLKIKCARRGLHWLKVLRQIKVENWVTDELGIALDHGSGGGGGANKNTRTAGAETETETTETETTEG